MSPMRVTDLRRKIGQHALDAALQASSSTLRRSAGRVVLAVSRKLMSGDRDPVVTRTIGGTSMQLPLSHRLPDYLERYPNYGTNVVRLAKFLVARSPQMSVIDIGANIGDTAALLREATDAPVLCVEADDHYFSLLEANARRLGSVVCVKRFLGRSPATIRAALQTSQGTGHVVAAASALEIGTLDDLLGEHPGFIDAQLLKVDVDGVDFEIVAGGVELLRRSRPVLFLEYDPTLVAAQGLDARAALTWLREEGYGHFVAYDNVGDMAFTGSLDDSLQLDDLHAYAAAKRSLMFWDLAVFHQQDEVAFAAFAASERRWCASRGHGAHSR